MKWFDHMKLHSLKKREIYIIITTDQLSAIYPKKVYLNAYNNT